MGIVISETKNELGKKAAQKGAGLIRKAIKENGTANIIIATGDRRRFANILITIGVIK